MIPHGDAANDGDTVSARLVGAVRLRSNRTGSDRGMVMLEVAFAIPALLAITTALVWCVSLAAVHARVTDTARMAARLSAMGVESDAIHQQIAVRSPDATVTREDADGLVTITVAEEMSIPVPILRGLTVRISASSAAAQEPFDPLFDGGWGDAGDRGW